MNMNISQVGIDLIKSFEGLYLTTYDDLQPKLKLTTMSQVKGTLTIGYGHTGNDVKIGQTITKQQAEDMLVKDLKSYVAGVNNSVKVKVNQNQFDALVSFAYNCGVGALQTSLLLTKLNKGDIQGASEEFARWNKAGGNVLAGLTRRRAAEKDLFLKPVAEANNDSADEKVIVLSANQLKDKALLVKHGFMAANFEVKTGEMVALITMQAAMVRKLEAKGVL